MPSGTSQSGELSTCKVFLGLEKIIIFYHNCSIGNGSFTSTGVQLIRNTSVDNTTTVLCESTHLTSFAVLVDVRGKLQVKLDSEIQD